MKTIICTLGLILAFSITNAQTSSSSTSKVSVSYSDDSPGKRNYRVSISINNDDETFEVNASFPGDRTEKLKKFLKEQLETKMTHTGSSYYWHSKNKGETIYKVKLKRGRLTAFLDKEMVSIDLVDDFIDVFQDLKEVIKE